MFKRLSVALVTVLAVLVAVPTALAYVPPPAPPAPPVGVPDQSTAGPASGRYPFHFISSPAQTFTAGVDGKLTTVVISLQNDFPSPGDIYMDVMAVDGSGIPDASAVLATSDPIPDTSLPSGSAADTTFTFPTPVAITAGRQYAFVIRPTDFFFSIMWLPLAESTYAGGQAFEACCGIHPVDFFPLHRSSFIFTTYLLSTQQNRAGYCSVAGNTDQQTGDPIPAGTFLNLTSGQADGDAHYKGATPAYYYQGMGISCDVLPGYTKTGEMVGYWGHGDPGGYTYMARN